MVGKNLGWLGPSGGGCVPTSWTSVGGNCTLTVWLDVGIRLWALGLVFGPKACHSKRSKVAECSKTLPKGSGLLCLTDEDTELLTGKLPK